MQAQVTNLQSIIEGTKQYLVPLFQRTYSWKKKDWEKMWQNINELTEADNPRDHFIGSIVTVPTTSVPHGVAKFLLIDGQQRLTTIFIILTLLRNKAEAELSEEINNTLLVNPYKKSNDHFKLLPTQVDREPFQRLISGTKEENDTKNSIIEAYEFFEKKLIKSELDGQKIKDAITSNLSLVSITLDPDENPYLVFESLNASGQALTQADLIRNYFFMKIHTDFHDEVHATLWKPMEDALGVDLLEFVRHYLMREGAFIKQSDIYFSLKDIVDEENATNSLNELKRYSDYYIKILSPTAESNLTIRKSLSRLKKLDTTTVYPLLLNMYGYYEDDKIKDTEFAQVLNIIENFLLRRYICSLPTDRLKSIFPPLHSHVLNSNSKNYVDGVKAVLQSKDYPKDHVFRQRLLDAKLYGSSDKIKKITFILQAIEESYYHKEQVSFSDLNVSVEHVMPQTITSEWKEHLGEEWETVHDLYKDTLGNLTLTGYNSELSNAIFNKKKEHYKKSHLEVNKYFRDTENWRKEDIERRANFLADRALKIWSYFGNESIAEASIKENVIGKSPKQLYVLGKKYSVTSWRDVIVQTLNSIMYLEPEKFEKLIVRYPNLITRDSNKFHRTRNLNNDYFINVNSLTSDQIYRYCLRMLEAVDLPLKDFKVETDAKTIGRDQLSLNFD
ncbi:DUF262 domain-containing protein [Peribacillus sp. NPDC101481]|uniref:DUF262 domain-containing protein n=1 Tax=Peribacillus sp. NPDC101481 TaxID=3364403 RepID=UPI003803D835